MTVTEIRVGVSSCGLAAGAKDVMDALKEKSGVPVIGVGCIGHCYAEPLVEVVTESDSLLFSAVTTTPSDLEAVLAGDVTRAFVPDSARTSKELHRVTRRIGDMDPISIEDYRQRGGFQALHKAVEMTPDAVVDEVARSGLRGRGGGGFPTGSKWSLLARHDREDKVIICNADEGDPGAFMDRSLMESLPYQVLEGMLVAAHATGASKLIIYCRAEYPLAIRNLKTAIAEIQRTNRDSIRGRQVEIFVKEGAGAFVCGEETALIHSLEGKRGMPRFRPPFPTDSGYFGAPSMINNVETFANIPLIIDEGADSYASVGTAGSTGTKLFALAGDIPRPGLVEVPMGITLREIICDIGGARYSDVKAVQTGGPSGGCIPASLFDTPIDYDSLGSLGAIMGSGGLIVIGTNRCIVETARYFLDFTHRESCGKCTFCRVGAKRMFEAMERITNGTGSEADISFLTSMGKKVQNGSLCGLGKTAPNPVLAALRYFPDEFEAHVSHYQCPALECAALCDVYIDKEKCTECRLCLKACPVDAISDDFVVDNEVCTRCNSCIEVCRDDAPHRVPRGYPGKEEGL